MLSARGLASEGRREGKTNFMEMLAAPFGGVLACVSVKDSKVALSSNPTEIVEDRKSVV